MHQVVVSAQSKMRFKPVHAAICMIWLSILIFVVVVVSMEDHTESLADDIVPEMVAGKLAKFAAAADLPSFNLDDILSDCDSSPERSQNRMLDTILSDDDETHEGVGISLIDDMRHVANFESNQFAEDHTIDDWFAALPSGRKKRNKSRNHWKQTGPLWSARGNNWEPFAPLGIVKRYDVEIVVMPTYPTRA